MKFLFLFFTSIYCLSCSAPKQQIEELEIVKTNNVLREFNRKEVIIGSWNSVKKINNDRILQFQDSFTLNFDSTGKFNSLYKPSNIKTGNWYLISDTILELSMKAVDQYIIKKLTNDTLIIKPFHFGDNNTYVLKKQLTPK